MARSREEARAELRRLFQESDQDRVELEDILLEHDGKLLVRKSSLMRLGDKRFWGSVLKFGQTIPNIKLDFKMMKLGFAVPNM